VKVFFSFAGIPGVAQSGSLKRTTHFCPDLSVKPQQLEPVVSHHICKNVSGHSSCGWVLDFCIYTPAMLIKLMLGIHCQSPSIHLRT